ncbi:hypothetical protein niasHS_007041 [Heterodera schachtii]|uniref:SSD domain-containing protein n=1 Tax=Heterodera schachtii TaxID=97005 RepID=A0ABD2JFJ7_HETSC
MRIRLSCSNDDCGEISFDFFYQITPFTAVLICARLEFKAELKSIEQNNNSNSTSATGTISSTDSNSDEHNDTSSRAKFTANFERIANAYIKFVSNIFASIGIVIGTFVCMSIICAAFMNFKPFVVAVTSIVIACILTETLGIMALIGLTIDPVVMAGVIISMGFSVDIPAHISAFYGHII